MENKHLERARELLGGTVAVARAMNITPASVSEWITGRRAIPLVRAAQIERLTKGKVKARQLRPDIDWSLMRDLA